MRTVTGVMLSAIIWLAPACRPADILSVPAPSGVTQSGALDSQTGAESEFNTARFQTFNGLVGQQGLIEWSGLLTDEFTWSDFSRNPRDVGIDARITGASVNGLSIDVDPTWQFVLQGRSSMLLALPLLERYEPSGQRSTIGEAFALTGYAEILLAEDYCAGTTLDQVLPNGQGYVWGTPLTTDSLFGAAEAHFDSALAYANGNATIANLAHVGLARTLLDRNRTDSATAAVQTVPTAFVYNTDLPPTFGQGGLNVVNLYAFLFTDAGGPVNRRFVTVSNREGENGLNYVSAGDPRVVIDSSLGQTNDGTTWYFPAKFEGPGQEYIPLATGTEARLIEAESALHAGQINSWATDLNALRSVAGMAPLTADSTTTASAAVRIDVMFRERAFWLYGLGSRLGDLRRLVRQYGRDQSTVFPTGPYPNGNNPNLPTPLPNYGTDVSLTPPNGTDGSVITNPNYKGCINHNA